VNRTRPWIALGVGAALVVGAVVIQRWWHNRPPYDERSHRKPPIIDTGSPGIAVGANGWNAEVDQRYPWLHGAGPIHRDSGWTETGVDLTVALASGTTSATFVAVFPNADPSAGLHATAPVDLSRLLMGLVFVGDDSQVYWSRRLYG
jgi:hypothetical protein